MKKTIIFLSFFLVLNTGCTFAQFYFSRVDSVSVKIGANSIKFPFSGGQNFIQASEIDLNYDGIKDLFLFDRTGDKVSTFINNGTSGAIDYSYAHQYIKAFPHLQNWALLRDYNGDGKEDIFTNTNAGIMVYQNDGNSTTGLHFTLVKSLIYAWFNDNPQTNYLNLYVTSTDIPAIVDADGDGDLEIITFDFAGTRMQYFRNYSQEQYGHLDSLNYYVLTDNCYGDFAENFSNNSVTLDVCAPGDHLSPQPNIPDESTRHAGSCTFCTDLTGDGLPDLVVGDISFPNLTFLQNGGNSDTADIVFQDNNYPSYDTPVNQPIFPCGYYLDVNNDQIRDMIVSPSSTTCVNSAASLWLYENQNDDDSAYFHFLQSNFIQDQMIDVGEGAYPAFFDYNVDGLMDLVVGNYGAMIGNCTYVGKLALFKNIGTSTFPKFELVTRDYSTISSLNIQNPVPAFGDLDGDGDKDMLIGASDGRLYYFQNTAGSGATANFTINTSLFNAFSVGQFAAPTLVDINRDGDLDLICGRSNGRLNYYENTGNAGNPVFSSTPVGNFGGVNVTPVNVSVGYSFPVFFEVNSVYHLLVGSTNGALHHYTNIDGNLSGTFTHADSLFQNIFEGIRCAPALADLTNDGQFEMVLGNYCGGLHFYMGDTLASVNGMFNSSNGGAIEWSVIPNPSNGEIQLSVPDFWRMQNAEIIINDLSGRVVFKSNLSQSLNTYFNLDYLNSGLYFVQVNIKGEKFVKRLVIND